VGELSEESECVSTAAAPVREWSGVATNAYLDQRLSPREIEALQMAADGETCKTSGERMGIVEGSVKHLRHSAMLKLGADCTAHAVAQAMRRGFIK
jgi:DNA-binding CsgD family transcriptional regulator